MGLIIFDVSQSLLLAIACDVNLKNNVDIFIMLRNILSSDQNWYHLCPLLNILYIVWFYQINTFDYVIIAKVLFMLPLICFIVSKTFCRMFYLHKNNVYALIFIWGSEIFDSFNVSQANIKLGL